MDDLVTRLRELLAKATPGDWECNNNVGVVFGAGCHVANCGNFDDQELVPYNAERWAADARLIASLKTNAPSLLDEIEAQRAELARVRALGDALQWYKNRVLLCRRLGSDGDNARQALDNDGGQRARAALAAWKEPH